MRRTQPITLDPNIFNFSWTLGNKINSNNKGRNNIDPDQAAADPDPYNLKSKFLEFPGCLIAQTIPPMTDWRPKKSASKRPDSRDFERYDPDLVEPDQVGSAFSDPRIHNS